MIVKSVSVELDEHYFQWLRARGDRATYGEVIMLIPRHGGKVLTLTKSFYPEGTHSLPSGGIEPGETPEVAFVREVAEETGLEVDLRCEIGCIKHHCVFGDESLDFVSYVVLGTQSDGPAHPLDSEEHISGYADASASDLRQFAEHMRSLTGRWAGFGRFRATALDFVADLMADSLI